MIANGMIYRDTQIERQKENRNKKGIGVEIQTKPKNILPFPFIQNQDNRTAKLLFKQAKSQGLFS